MLTQLSARQLRRAADLVDAIGKAKKELSALLGAPAPKAAKNAAPQPATKASKKAPRASTRKGVGRPNTMAGAVREILAGAGKPLTPDEIIKLMTDAGRPLGKRKNARKIFGAHLYQMAGVKRVGRGLFASTK